MRPSSKKKLKVIGVVALSALVGIVLIHQLYSFLITNPGVVMWTAALLLTPIGWVVLLFTVPIVIWLLRYGINTSRAGFKKNSPVMYTLRGQGVQELKVATSTDELIMNLLLQNGSMTAQELEVASNSSKEKVMADLQHLLQSSKVSQDISQAPPRFFAVSKD